MALGAWLFLSTLVLAGPLDGEMADGGPVTTDGGAGSVDVVPAEAAEPVPALAPSPGGSALGTAPTPEVNTRLLLVVPVVAGPEVGRELAVFLTGILTREMARLGRWEVMAQEEVVALVKEEELEQLVGIQREGVAAAGVRGTLDRLSDMMAVQRVVLARVDRVNGRLAWSAWLTETSTGNIVARATVVGGTADSLAAQVEDLASALHGIRVGRVEDAPDAQQRLQLGSADDVDAFRAWRRQRPALATGDAFTSFILERNGESQVLATAEVVLFGAAAVAAVLTLALALGSGLVGFTAGGGHGFALMGFALVAAAVSAWAGMAGVAAVIVDMLDLGRVEVNAAGCCRDDATLLAAQADDGVERGAAIAVMAMGPATLAGALATGTLALALDHMAPLGAALAPDVGSNVQFTSMWFALLPVVLVVAGLMLAPPILVSPAVGLLLLLRRPAAMVGPARSPPRERPRAVEEP